MQQVITLKVTPAELDVIDWLVRVLDLKSRSDAIRQAILQSAIRNGIRQAEVAEVACQRYDHPPIRSGRVRTIQDNVILDEAERS